MAATARQAQDKKEHFDSPEVLDAKVTTLAGWIRESQHTTAFTGAGVSTAAGIADFRSGMDTVLPTGPGCWELRAHVGRGAKAPTAPKAKVSSTLRAFPTRTHMTLCALQRAGLLHHLSSQNCDGLHRRSGFPTAHLSELHGNSNLERCKKCGKEYLRDFKTRRQTNSVHVHDTGRVCDDSKCKGILMDTIVNFGESLPEKEITAAFDNANRASLCIAMGSSLTVTPAADVPATTAKRGTLVVINLQPTPLDGVCKLRINGLCDQVMELLARKLELDVLPWTLQRRLRIERPLAGQWKVSCYDKEGQPFSLVATASLQTGTGPSATNTQVHKATSVSELAQTLKFEVPAGGSGEARAQLSFLAHYNEPRLCLPLGDEPCRELLLELSFAGETPQWHVSA